MTALRDNELISRIMEVWNDYEEPYHLGAWERFQRRKKKRIAVFTWKKTSGIAAAVVLIVVTTLLIDRMIETGMQPQTEIAHEQKVRDHAESEISKNSSSEPDHITDESSSAFNNKKKNVETPPGNTFPLTMDTSQQALARSNDLKIQEITRLSNPEFSIIQKPMKNDSQINHEQSLLLDETLNSKKRSNSFHWGFALAPTLSSGSESKTDMGFSGGITTDWVLTRKISLSTGLFMTQSQLNYDSEIGESPRTASNLNHVQVSLISMEIPVNVQYHINSRFYIATGFSSATFLREAYDYTYEHPEVKPVIDPDGEGPQLLLETETTFETEEISEPALNSFYFPAFYNLSLGYQYQLENKYALSVEPFIKLPLTEIATKEIKYSTGGVQLKIRF